MREQYRCWAEIDRSALRHNAAVARERTAGAELLAVVKANAYGHGMMGVAEALRRDVQLFGVANVEEATMLRASLLHPIIVLGPALPEERSTIVERGFIPTVSSVEEAQAFASSGRVAINFKIDTGMGRMGIVESETVPAFRQIRANPNITIHSVSTHLPVANEEAEYTRGQLERFGRIVRRLRSESPGEYKVHVLQSSGTLAFNEMPHDIVRAGIMLYGISPLPEFQKLLRPAMTWKTRIGLIRDVPKGTSISYGRTFIAPRPMRVATVTAGYADGYPRHLSNRAGQMIAHGKRCDLLGRVTMDLMVIDVSHLRDADVGDEVVLVGRQGEQEISANELAEKAGTISWEITTRIGQRVKRVFV